MQTLPAGSFLHLENDGNLESLKFTARCLAEHTGSVIKENLTAQSLESLANNLWQKAEYVTRETERRRLQQIFVENFIGRFRELKPDVEELTNLIANSVHQSFNSEMVVNNNLPTAEKFTPTETSTEKEEKNDEFLGLVKTDSSFEEGIVSQTAVSTMTATVTESPIVESEPETKSEIVATENQTRLVETPISPDTQLPEKVKFTTEKIEVVNTPPAAPQIKNNPTATPAKTIAKTDNAKEPFEFGKCTVSLNLVLFAGSGSDNGRKVIISAVSHNLPPEIEYLEITNGDDLDEIANLVKHKLERFRQTLPVKYMEQLRATKNKTAKSPATTPKQRETSAANAEKTSGNQQLRDSVITAQENTGQTGATENANQTTVPVEVVPPPVAANNVQLSLF